MEFRLEHARGILERTPATLSILVSDLSQEWQLANEGPESWSAFDIVGHLIHGEKTDWIPRARMILEHGESRPFEPFDRFAMFEHSRGKSLSDLLPEFADLRADSLRQLDAMSLTAELLEKRGMHPELGSVSLRQLLATWVVHDVSHIAQIARVMSKQYRDAVGPWQEYLPILTK